MQVLLDANIMHAVSFFGPYEHPHSMLQNKMAAAKLGFEIYVLTTIPERADVGDGSGGERGTSETPPKPLRRREGHRAVLMGSKVVIVSM